MGMAYEEGFSDADNALRRFPNSLIPPELVFLPLFCVVEALNIWLCLGLHALKMNKNTASSGISLSVNRLKLVGLLWLIYPCNRGLLFHNCKDKIKSKT